MAVLLFCTIFTGCGDEARLEQGDTVSYEIYAHCGVEVLGNLDGAWWTTDEAAGRYGWIPSGWEADSDAPFGSLVAKNTMAADGGTISAEYRGRTVIYERAPSGFEPPLCD